MTESRLWVLGASDPEMEAIEGILRECGERVAYALDECGERVHAGNAYQAARPPVSDDQYDCVYAVECGGDWFGALNVWSPLYDDEEEPVLTGCVRLDHHRPGDPGFGRPPSEFLEASSVGQVIAELARLGAFPASGPDLRPVVSIGGNAVEDTAALYDDDGANPARERADQ